MKKEILNVYLEQNNLPDDCVLGVYEFNTGSLNSPILFNNYYSGTNYGLLSITGFQIISGGAGYTNGDTGRIVANSNEFVDLTFIVNTSAGTVDSAYMNGNVGNIGTGNVAGNVGTGLYFTVPIAEFPESETGTGAVIIPLTRESIDYTTRYDLFPLVGIGATSGPIRSGISPTSTTKGSGVFRGRDSLRFADKFDYDNWTVFIDFKNSGIDPFLGKSRILLSSYTSFTNTTGGFALTINDANRLNFEYRDQNSGINSFPVDIQLQDYNLVSVSNNRDGNKISIGYHNLAEDEHNIETFDINYPQQATNKQLYFGGVGASYPNTIYTGFNGLINEILVLKESLNDDQLITLSKAFYTTGYDAPTLSYNQVSYLIPTGVVTQEISIGSGISGYSGTLTLTTGADGSVTTGYTQSGISGNITSSGTLILYGSESGSYFEEVQVSEKFYYDTGQIRKYAPNLISLENTVENQDVIETYYFDIKDSIFTPTLQAEFSSKPGSVYVSKEITGKSANLYYNGIFQVSGVDYSLFLENNSFETTGNVYYTFNKEKDVYTSTLQSSGYLISGFDFIPSSSSDYALNNFPLDLTLQNGYLLYLNGQKLTSGSSYDYTYDGTNLIILTSGKNYESGRIEIGAIRSGKTSTDSIGSKIHEISSGDGSYLYSSAQNLIDEVIFFNGQRLYKNLDYVKTTSGNLNIRKKKIENKDFQFYNNEDSFFELGATGIC